MFDSRWPFLASAKEQDATRSSRRLVVRSLSRPLLGAPFETNKKAPSDENESFDLQTMTLGHLVNTGGPRAFLFLGTHDIP